MSPPRTNAAIAEDLEAWADNVPPSQFAAGVLREAAAALRKEPPVLPAEVEAVVARLDSLIVTISDSEGESVHVPMVCLQAATLLRRYAQAVAEKVKNEAKA